MNVEQDSDRRIIYQAGDVVGVANYGFLGKLAYKIFEPQTPFFHFFLIDGYLKGEDDYSIIESVAKGPTMGRLSWYAKRDYQVFRVNEEHKTFWPVFNTHKYRLNASRSAEYLGEIAVGKASKFGRHGYDFALYLKLLVGALQFQVNRLAHGERPRRMTPEDVPYSRDKSFVCTELVFEAWRAVGIELRAPGHAPIPCEFVLAEARGELNQIDFHNGTQGQTWRSRQTGPPRLALCPRSEMKREGCGMCSLRYVCDDPGRDDVSIMSLYSTASTEIKPKPGPDLIGRQGGQKRNRVHVYRQPHGYPIRFCDGETFDKEDLEALGKCTGGDGSSEPAMLKMALALQERTPGVVICKHCLAILDGKRGNGSADRGYGVQRFLLLTKWQVKATTQGALI